MGSSCDERWTRPGSSPRSPSACAIAAICARVSPSGITTFTTSGTAVAWRAVWLHEQYRAQPQAHQHYRQTRAARSAHRATPCPARALRAGRRAMRRRSARRGRPAAAPRRRVRRSAARTAAGSRLHCRLATGAGSVEVARGWRGGSVRVRERRCVAAARRLRSARWAVAACLPRGDVRALRGRARAPARCARPACLSIGSRSQGDDPTAIARASSSSRTRRRTRVLAGGGVAPCRRRCAW